MRIRALVFAGLLALTGAACQPNDDTDAVGETDASAEEFALTGTVIDAKAGVQPDGGFPEEQDPPASGEEPTYGGIAVRPDDADAVTGLDDCETQQDAYVTYYVGDSDFEPPELEDDADFPVSLEGRRVNVTGTVEQPNEDEDTDTEVDADVDAEATDGGADVEAEVDTTTEPETDGCVLVVEEVEIAVDTAATDDAGTGQGTGGTATDEPDATGSPEVTEPASTPGLPEGVEDTDPIFGGTPSPDPCEGQKACEENDQ